ncbi:hypothetical protein Tco_0487526 [Tanacetum coccineum]
MTTLKFADTHNMVAFLSKPAKSDGFEQIVDFLNAQPIRYALTVNPTIYISCIEQFWSIGMVKTINEEVQLHALVDGKKIIISEAYVRRDLKLEDEEGMIRNLDNLSGKFLMYPRFVQVFLNQQLDGLPTHKRIYNAPSHTKKNFGNMRRVGKGFSGRVTPLFPTMVVQNQAELGEGSANPTDPRHTPTITQPSTSQPQKTQKPRKPKRKNTHVPQPSGSSKHVADEVVHKELGDSSVRAAITASSLEAEQDSGNITKTRSKATPNECSSLGTTSGGGPKCQETMGDIITQTRFENVSKLSNDSLLAKGNTLQSDEDSLKLKELMELCTTLQSRVLDFEKTKTTQANEIASLKMRVKKLEKKRSSRTQKLKRLYKVGLTARVESSGNEEDLGEDASKQGKRINAIDADKDITLSVCCRQNEKWFVEEVVNAAQVSTVATTVTITTKEITLAQALEALKLQNLRMQAQEQEELSDVEKATLFQQLLEKKRKHFAAKRAEEQRNKPPTKVQQRKIMCNYLKNMEGYKLKDLKLKYFDSIQKMFDRALNWVNTFENFRTELMEGKEKRAGAELVQESTKKQKVDDDKDTAELQSLMEVIPDKEEVAIDVVPLATNQMLKSFDMEDLEDLYKSVKARYGSTRPVEKHGRIQAQIFEVKNFDSIQEMFDKALKRANTFEDFRTELVEGKEKKAGAELVQESTKKQKVDEDKDTAELQILMEVIPDEEEVAIDVVPLATKSPKIMYMIFSQMLKSFNMEDLEDLYKLVKARYGSTRPVESMDYLLWNDLKIMFEPHVEDGIYMLVEKKLQFDYESEKAYQLFNAVEGVNAASEEVSTAYIPYTCLDDGLVPLMAHEDVVKLLQYVPRFREVDVYVEEDVLVVRQHIIEVRFRIEHLKGLVIKEIVQEVGLNEDAKEDLGDNGKQMDNSPKNVHSSG